MSAIEYQELEIEISRCLCGKKEVRLLDSRLSRPRERFDPGYDADDLNRRLERLDELILEGPVFRGERRELARGIGRELYAALLPGKVGSTFDASLAALYTAREKDPDLGMRIRLSFGEPDRHLAEVLGLPWELVCAPDTGMFPARTAETPMVRHLDLGRPVEALAVRPPLRILAVLTSPRDLPAIDRGRHREALGRVGTGGLVEVDYPVEASLNGVQEALEKGRAEGRPFHGFHFLGHGAFDEKGDGYLNFEDGHGRRSRVPADALSDILGSFQELRLATLASCSSGRTMRYRGQHPFAGVAPALLVRGLSAVVGMQFPVSEGAAESFVAAFYRNLAEGRSVEEAVTRGRLGILVADGNSLEWASPVLFLRSREGRVLDVKAVPEGDGDEVPRAEPSGNRSGSVFIDADSKSGRDTTIAGHTINTRGDR